MSDPVSVDLFVEDRAHEEFIGPLVHKVANAAGLHVRLAVRSARGGHGRAIEEFRLYQRAMVGRSPAVIVVAIDGNCSTFARKRGEIRSAADEALLTRLVVACPDPHIERWYLSDPEAFQRVVGIRPQAGKRKCVRDHYKRLLATHVQRAGHPATLGGIEFARELVAAMDLYQAGRHDRSLRNFVDDLRARLREASTR